MNTWHVDDGKTKFKFRKGDRVRMHTGRVGIVARRFTKSWASETKKVYFVELDSVGGGIYVEETRLELLKEKVIFT